MFTWAGLTDCAAMEFCETFCTEEGGIFAVTVLEIKRILVGFPADGQPQKSRSSSESPRGGEKPDISFLIIYPARGRRISTVVPWPG